MTVGTNALLEGRRRAPRSGHRGLHRHRGARPPGARRAVPAVRRASAAARAARAAHRRARALRPGRRAARARQDELRERLAALRERRRGGGGLPAVGLSPSRARAARRRLAREALAGRARVDLARDRRRVPRVRALRHNGRRRRPLAPAAPLPRAPTERAAEAGLPAPGGDALERRRGRRRSPRSTARGRCCRAAGGAVARRGRPRWPAPATPSASTWAAPRATCRSSPDGRVAVTGGREVGGRALALPMVDVHTVGAGGGSDRLARRRRRAARRARGRRAPTRGPPVTAAAGPSRR